MKTWDPSFDKLSNKEQKLLNLGNKPAEPVDPLKQQVKGLTRGVDQKRLERDLRKLERAEWE